MVVCGKWLLCNIMKKINKDVHKIRKISFRAARPEVRIRHSEAGYVSPGRFFFYEGQKENVFRKRIRTTVLFFFLIAAMCASLCGCGTGGIETDLSSGSAGQSAAVAEGYPAGSASETQAVSGDHDISAFLTLEDEMSLAYAKCFRIFRYRDGYALVNLCDGSRFLVVPEGQAVPEDLSQEITVLRQPVNHIYLAASAAMQMFVRMDALDCIALSGMKADQWSLPEVRDAMRKDTIRYAGRYSAPDYELILSRDCDLAIENTMIFHTPSVREQLIRTGVPVLVDHASYEPHPLGRTEWVKLYGVLTGHVQEAEQAFLQQEADVDAVLAEVEQTDGTAGQQDDETGKRSVAFFSVNSAGAVTVRKSTDYVPAMIRMAGGQYAPKELSDGSRTSTTTLQMEAFCRSARDADLLVYNGTIEGEIDSIERLLQKAPALKDFRAVKEGHVWCTSRNLYQDSMETGTIIADFHQILTDPDGSGDGLRYLRKLKNRNGIGSAS